jgi:hypothetical protein
MGASKHFILRNAWCRFFFFLNYTQWVGTYLIPIGYHKKFFLNKTYYNFYSQ